MAKQAKNNAKNNGNKKTKKNKVGNQKRTKMAGGSSMYNSVYAQKMLALYANPCAADLVPPPYGGTDAGYLVRTVDQFVPIISTDIAGATQGDHYVSWAPWNYGTGTGYVVGGNAVGRTFNVGASSGPGNFINTSVVDTFRPVASCMEWIPTDALLTRSGTIAFGYAPSVPVPAGSTTSASQIAPLTLKTETNQSGKYFCNWLPTLRDETFTPNGVAGAPVLGVGTVFALLQGVATASPTTVGGQSPLNGYFKVTTVWEWTPRAANGIVVDPKTPSTWTVGQVLNGVKDIKQLLMGASDVVTSGYNLFFGGTRYNTPTNLLMYH